MRDWLFLVYKIPREPSALRVGIWRKLNRLGAVLSHDSVWVLPDNLRTRENFQWLAAEINQQGGRATTWSARATLEGQDATLEAAFLEAVEPEYRQVLQALQTDEADLPQLSKQFLGLQARDHLKSALGKQVKAALEAARGNA